MSPQTVPYKIIRGDRVLVEGCEEPLVASRDEFNNRVFLMSEEDYRQHQLPGEQPVKEQPYLVLPDRTLVRHYEHGFSDQKYDGK